MQEPTKNRSTYKNGLPIKLGMLLLLAVSASAMENNDDVNNDDFYDALDVFGQLNIHESDQTFPEIKTKLLKEEHNQKEQAEQIPEELYNEILKKVKNDLKNKSKSTKLVGILLCNKNKKTSKALHKELKNFINEDDQSLEKKIGLVRYFVNSNLKKKIITTEGINKLKTKLEEAKNENNTEKVHEVLKTLSNLKNKRKRLPVTFWTNGAMAGVMVVWLIIL